MPVRPLYASRAVDDVSQEQLMIIHSQSKVHHPARGSTGVHCLALLGEPMATASIVGRAGRLPAAVRP